MSTYVRTETVEAMQWRDHAAPGGTARHMYAEDVVAWVNANGGEARYKTYDQTRIEGKLPAPSIALRTSDGGWAYAAPGDWILMGDLCDKYVDLAMQRDWTKFCEFTVIRAADWAAAGWQPADTAAQR